MSVWIIEPRDPILLRDGRPFGAAPGGRAKSVDFPFPSTTTGAARQRIGQEQDPAFPRALIAQLLGTAVCGPLLVELSETDDRVDFLAPAPADQVLLKVKEPPADVKLPPVELHRLAPKKLPPDYVMDLEGLAPVAMVSASREKPASGQPRFWNWETYETWLTKPGDQQNFNARELGHSGPSGESRVHVSIDPARQTADDGKLFQTNSLAFTRRVDGAPRSLGLALTVAAELSPGFGTLGGERRLVRWAKREDIELPSCPADVRTNIRETGACRVLLLTPAMFEDGFRPQSLLSLVPGLKVTLVAAVVNRPNVVSGWDYAANPERAKPSRRLAPAGSVYFLKLDGTREQRSAFVDRVWMHCISDGISGAGTSAEDIGQDNRDGFGLAAVGVWPEGKEWD